MQDRDSSGDREFRLINQGCPVKTFPELAGSREDVGLL
jgi:hypothetical protein